MSSRLPAPDGSDLPPIDGEIERALAFVPRPAATVEFRMRLRARFLEIDPDLRAAASVDEPHLRRGLAPVARTDDLWRRRLLSVSAIAAAAAVLIVIFVLRPRGPRWQVLDGTETGFAKIDGSTIATGERTALAAALTGATVVETGAAMLRLRLGDLYLLELAPGTRITLSALDKHSRSDPLSVRAERGALRLRTGPDFKGSLMRVSTSDLDLRVTGTALAVDLLEDIGAQGTCVCCLHGSIEVRAGAKIAASKAIPAGDMCVVYRDKQAAPAWGSLFEPHATPLRALEEIARALWPEK